MTAELEWLLILLCITFCTHFPLNCNGKSYLWQMCNGMWRDVPTWCSCSSRSETWTQPVQQTSPFPLGKCGPFFQSYIVNAQVSRAHQATFTPAFWTVFRSRWELSFSLSMGPTYIRLCQIPFYLSICLTFINTGLIPALLTCTVETKLDSEVHAPFY